MADVLKVTIKKVNAETVVASFQYKGRIHSLEIRLREVVVVGDTPEAVRKKIEVRCQAILAAWQADDAAIEMSSTYQAVLQLHGHDVPVKMLTIEGTYFRWAYFWRGEWHDACVHFSPPFCNRINATYNAEGLTRKGIQLIQERTAGHIKHFLEQEKLPTMEVQQFLNSL